MAYQITEEMLQSYERALLLEEHAQSTAQKYLRDIRAFWGWAESERPRQEKEADGEEGRKKERSQEEKSKAGERKEKGNQEEKGKAEESKEEESKEEPGRMVDKELVARWKEELVGKGYAPVTINGMLSSLNGFFGFLGWEDCKVKFLKIQRRVFRDIDRELSQGEYKRLLDAAQKEGNLRTKLLLETICGTGIRVSEVKYITVESVKKGRTDISLKGKIRTIIIPGKLCKKLREYIRKRKISTGEIFLTRTGKGMTRAQIWKEMKKLCGAAGVKPSKVFPHNLRHLFARTFYKACKDIVKLADVLGHSSIDTTRIYLISTGEVHARQMDRLGLVS